MLDVVSWPVAQRNETYSCWRHFPFLNCGNLEIVNLLAKAKKFKLNRLGTTTMDSNLVENEEVSMVDVLDEDNELEAEANAVLGDSDDQNCTYDKVISQIELRIK